MGASTGTARTIWLAVILLAPVALLNYLDRQMLASMKFSVMADIRDVRTDAHWGMMLAQFKWVYAVLSPIGGYLADRFSRKWIICFSLVAWSSITWLTGHAHSFQELLWARTSMGISEAFYIPAGLALIVDYHSGPTKSRATGIHMAAIYVGVIFGGFAGYVADAPDLGWRLAFNLTGAIGVIYVVPLLFLLRDAPRASDRKPMRVSPVGALGSLLRNPSFLCLAICFTLIAWPGWMMKDWMPAMLKTRFELSQGKAGISAGLYVNLACIAGVVLGGFLADRWVLKTLKGRVFVSAIGTSIVIPALFGLGFAPSLAVAIVFLALFGLGFGMFDCNNMPIVSQLVAPELRATAYGLMNFISIGLGGFADVAVGRLRDAGVSFPMILSLAAVVVMMNVVLILLIRPRPSLTNESSLP
ncbi:MAG: MFS transporter [Fimbriimonas sp.]|nr:MFS transporter [Fimbriimonas sp.]